MATNNYFDFKGREFWRVGGTLFNWVIVIACFAFTYLDSRDHKWFAATFDVLIGIALVSAEIGTYLKSRTLGEVK